MFERKRFRLPAAAVGCWLLAALLVGARALAEKPKNDAQGKAAGVQSLFDGKTLAGWKKTAFGGEGDVEVKDAHIVLHAGNPMTGITWTGKYPKMDYEISLEAMRKSGSDFFCGLTFPVGDAPCSFIVGGWGGGVVGLSSLDGNDASENETTKYQEFENGRWYAIRVRVTRERIEAWIDERQMVDVETKDRRISIRLEVELSRPLGIASYVTTAELRDIKLRTLGDAKK
jgi:3-keto-disaccharide hydrolase